MKRPSARILERNIFKPTMKNYAILVADFETYNENGVMFVADWWFE